MVSLEAYFNYYIIIIISFYIRSQRDPTLYWKLFNNGDILLSRDDAPTPFIIDQREPLKFSTPSVLINSDDIIISVPSSSSGKGKSVVTDNNGGLILGGRPDVFKFSDLIDSFERVDTDGYLRIFKTDKNLGEVWELV